MRQRMAGALALGLSTVCLSLAIGAATPSVASAACSVVPNYPIQQYLGNQEWYMWGHATITGCGSATVQLYLCEDLGGWYCSGRADHVRPQNANYTSLRLYAHCPGYNGSGRIATGWRINGGTRHVSSRVGRIC